MSKVVVLGSINQDVIATCEVRPKLGETVTGSSLSHLPGGVGANQAVAAASAESKCVLIGAVGNDPAAGSLVEFLKSRSVDTSGIRVLDGETTGTAIIVVDASGENNIVIIPGANKSAVDTGEITLEAGDVLLSQFEVPVESVIPFFERGRSNGCTNVLNPSPAAPIPDVLSALVDVFVLNETELESLSGLSVDISNQSSVVAAATSLGFTHATIVVTIGAQGAVVVAPSFHAGFSGADVTPVDTTGAGDCFVGSVAACLAQGETIENAIQYANKAAAISVTRAGAGPSMPSRAEVLS